MRKMKAMRPTARQDVREFATSEECIKELKKGGWEIWATDLSDVSPIWMIQSMPDKLLLDGMFFKRFTLCFSWIRPP